MSFEQKQVMPVLMSSATLHTLLKKHFGFDAFRAGQEAVCRYVTEGHDVLLVMPTGAGKSICYQLPALARQGTCLVISPLLALIEDQVAKLQSLGFKAERIHSGREREDSRRVCRDYLAGTLDFLFIAPERLAVPGFPELLSKRKPALIAIDEAHCISQWGHDFRPDYRLVGERIKDLRPAPVIALTATATPSVQEDICKQLHLSNEQRLIQGFRRTNIGIEVLELKPGIRFETIAAILQQPNRLPAIVYTTTRKKADELSTQLARLLKTDAYHAGMTPQARETVQKQFLNNELDAIVATIAFGMGIDKTNIRTVIHAALPASLEGYYQEIGRAGRDGKPSEAYLLHSFIDQKTHEFLIEKQDPEQPISPAQRAQKRKQLKQMAAFASSGKCRMMYLVSHFGDQNDGGQACGLCDVCAPKKQNSLVQKRQLLDHEQKTVAHLLALLNKTTSLAAGRIFLTLTERDPNLTRHDFEKLLTLLESISWLESQEASFEKSGENIAYRKISLLPAAKLMSMRDIECLEIAATPTQTNTKRKFKTSNPKISKENPIFEALRFWRRERAKQKNLPAFCILSDKVLLAICERMPQSSSELLQISGIGPKLLSEYGDEILTVLQGTRSQQAS